MRWKAIGGCALLLFGAMSAHAEGINTAAIFKALGEMDIAVAESLIDEAEASVATAEDREVLKRMKETLGKLTAIRMGAPTKSADFYKRAVNTIREWSKSRKRSDFESAMADLRIVLSREPLHLEAMVDLAGLLFEDGAFDAARQWELRALGDAVHGFSDAEERKWWQARRLESIARSCVMLKDFESARKFAALAVAKYPQFAAARHTLATALMGLGKTDDAIQHLNEVVRICESDDTQKGILPYALADRGIIALRISGNSESGVEDIIRALALAPHEGDVLHVDEQAKISLSWFRNMRALAEAKKSAEDAELPFLSQRLIKAADIAGWDFARLRYAINLMYAKHGFVSRSREIQSVFERKSWYRPATGLTMDDIDAKMSAVEGANVKILAEARDRLKGRKK